MAWFIKAECGTGNDSYEFAINMDYVESVDLTNKRVFMVGCKESFHIRGYNEWKRIVAWVENHSV